MADETPPPDAGEPSMDDLMRAMRELEVGQFLLSTVSTVASLAFGKLEAGDPAQARTAIEAIRALLPVLEGQVEPDLLRDLRAAVANLEVAYADAVGRAE